MGMGAPSGQASSAAAWMGRGPVTVGAEKGGVCRAGSHSEGDTPRGMFSRVDIGAFPISRWKGVTIMPWALGGLAQRAVPQVARKARWSFPSSSMASASRHWMSLVWDCWVSRVWKHCWILPPRWLLSSSSPPLLGQESSHPQYP